MAAVVGYAMDRRDGMSEAVRPIGVPPPSRTQTLWMVQVLRGVAALLVVIGHTESATASVILGGGGQFVRSALLPWGAGVDLFFVISGFIMVYASSGLFGQVGARGKFLRRRLVRIVPLYWLATTGFLLLLAVAAMKGGDAFPASHAILASYAFVPTDTYGNGRLFPVFDLGWTLNYEMFFYLLFSCVVGLPQFRALAMLLMLLSTIVLIGSWIVGPSAAWFWTRPIVIDFGLGVGVGAMVARQLTLPTALRGAMALAGIALLAADPGHVFNGPLGTTVANGWPRVVLAGLPIALVLAGAVLGREPTMPRIAIPFTRIGDASYSLYLFHPVALIAMEKLAQKAPLASRVPGSLIVGLTVVFAIATALPCYRRVERPMTAWLSRLWAVRTSVQTHALSVD